MKENIRLRSESGQQSRLKLNSRDQDYHLQRHERIEKDIDDLKTKLNEARKEFENADAAGFKRAAQDAKICQERLKSAKRRLRQCKILLR